MDLQLRVARGGVIALLPVEEEANTLRPRLTVEVRDEDEDDSKDEEPEELEALVEEIGAPIFGFG